MSEFTRALTPVVGAEHVDDLLAALHEPGEVRRLLAEELDLAAWIRNAMPPDTVADAARRRGYALAHAVRATEVLGKCRGGDVGEPAKFTKNVLDRASEFDAFLLGVTEHPTNAETQWPTTTVLALQTADHVALRTRDNAIATIERLLLDGGTGVAPSLAAVQITDALLNTEPDGG